MSKYFIIVLSTVILTSFQACYRTGIVRNDHLYSEKVNNRILKLCDSLEFCLDSETSPTIKYIQYFDADTIQALAILNNFNNNIYIYDCNTSNLIEKIKLNKEFYQGFCFDDNIYAYSYHKGVLSVINRDNYTVKQTIPMALQEDKYSEFYIPYPYASTLSPIMKYDKYIISVGYRSGESKAETISNRPVVTILNLKTKKISYAMNYPEMYSKYNWGGHMAYRLPYYTISPNGRIIVSFPASHDLAVSSLDSLSNVTMSFAGSRYIKEIKSYPAIKSPVGISSSDIWKWYMGNPSYEGILYDKYRELYYRIARLPDNDYENGVRGNHKPISIIVLDKHLNYLGEELLDIGPRYLPSNTFVSRNGINIQILTDNEDILKYYTYKYAEDNN